VSKAFTKESTHDEDEELALPALPAGAKNYITAEGYKRLQTELLQLIDVERPQVTEVVHWAAKNGDRSENGDYIYGKQRLRQIDRRIRFLTKRLEIAEVVDSHHHQGSEQIFFGAQVEYEEEDLSTGTIRTRCIRIVGIDEADTQQGQVSWVSPIARVLLKARVGDSLRLPSPAGEKLIEVCAVIYPG
jgi:transcription elongation factor GreB